MEKNNLVASGKVVVVLDSKNVFSTRVVVEVEKDTKPYCKYPEKYDYLK